MMPYELYLKWLIFLMQLFSFSDTYSIRKLWEEKSTIDWFTSALLSWCKANYTVVPRAVTSHAGHEPSGVSRKRWQLQCIKSVVLLEIVFENLCPLSFRGGPAVDKRTMKMFINTQSCYFLTRQKSCKSQMLTESCPHLSFRSFFAFFSKSSDFCGPSSGPTSWSSPTTITG